MWEINIFLSETEGLRNSQNKGEGMLNSLVKKNSLIIHRDEKKHKIILPPGIANSYRSFKN